MINRPPELEEFHKRHGKPLEVGMIVSVKDCKIDLTVSQIRKAAKFATLDCCGIIVDVEEFHLTYSPLDLEPIL